jgi:citrate lyase subunit beta / citryl-CoA lyase
VDVDPQDAPMPRSYLYAPGSSPRIIDKVLTAGADAVILDLEDSVAPDDRVTARTAVARLVRERAGSSPCAVYVRVGMDGDAYALDDVRAVVAEGLDGIRLPKAADPAAVRAVADALDDAEAEQGLARGTVALHLTIESALGLERMPELVVSPRVAAFAFGEADFLADIGASAGREATLYARSRLVVVSRSLGLASPADGAYTALDDLDGLADAARWARSLGFSGKSALHPRQLDAIHAAFTPTEGERRWAERVLTTVEGGVATAVVDGAFIDAPAIRRARGIVARTKGAT